MDALEMFKRAEEISGTGLKQGEGVSSDGSFEIVIEKAESGDSAAKFMAAKYFIAEHIDEETERAIRWVREAAEAGIEEAGKYIKEHGELFENRSKDKLLLEEQKRRIKEQEERDKIEQEALKRAEEERKEAQKAAEEKKRKAKKRVLIAVCCILAVAAAALLVVKVVMPEMKYKNAVS